MKTPSFAGRSFPLSLCVALVAAWVPQHAEAQNPFRTLKNKVQNGVSKVKQVAHPRRIGNAILNGTERIAGEVRPSPPRTTYARTRTTVTRYRSSPSVGEGSAVYSHGRSHLPVRVAEWSSSTSQADVSSPVQEQIATSISRPYTGSSAGTVVAAPDYTGQRELYADGIGVGETVPAIQSGNLQPSKPTGVEWSSEAVSASPGRPQSMGAESDRSRSEESQTLFRPRIGEFNSPEEAPEEVVLEQAKPDPSPVSNPAPESIRKANLPKGAFVAGKPGYVHSPYAKSELVDVSGIPAGTRVKCPYTSKHFLVP